ncbi:NADH-ubiquinone reductase complex 1 MLRQ subunit [Musa troglodytarum]|uniref:NADH-ubiquinone reductase complex 1 MLRQ subunit n=2 Tax=Musa troglodytarum TaxID=320322 RepID=A0A9E7HWZ9_9LILI|nr:NADH-ubiquinone reductase complex 1 MLRQ subunit [Musa troglodytarum]
MGRWVRPEVYPLMAAMTFVTSMCVFQLTRNILMNPDVRINKTNRTTAVLENAEEGEKYSQHSLRRFLSHRPPEVFPALNRFFSSADE